MFAKLICILAIPCIVLYFLPGFAELSVVQHQLQNVPETSKILSNDMLSFDEFLSLIDCIDNPTIASKLTEAQVDKIASLMALLAQKGVLTPNDELENLIAYDSQRLLSYDHSEFAYASVFSPSDYKHFYPDRTCSYEITPCGWVSKKWKQTRSFVRKHRTVIIIGAAVIVTATIAGIAIGAAAGAKTAGAGIVCTSPYLRSSASNSEPNLTYSPEQSPAFPHNNHEWVSSKPPDRSDPHLQPSSNEQFNQTQQIEADFKRLLVEVLPPEELHAADPNHVERLKNEIRQYSSLATHQVINDFESDTLLNKSDAIHIHQKADEAYTTNFSYKCPIDSDTENFPAIAHYAVGHESLESGKPYEAIAALDKAIQINPESTDAYLDRSIAKLQLGKHNEALEDFSQYQDRKWTTTVPEFTFGFVKGIPKGARDSCTNLIQLAEDIIVHPVQTGQQVWEALNMLSSMAKSGQWKEIGATLAPEVNELILEWDHISPDMRGEKAGYIFGKYGADIAIPGASAKLISKGCKGAKQLAIACKRLKTAEKTLLLEAATGFETASEIATLTKSATSPKTSVASSSFCRSNTETSHKLSHLLNHGKQVPNAGKIPPTQASSVIRWSVGDPINHLTATGKVPKWSTVRKRYWKNQAHYHPERFSKRNLERTKTGLSEQRKNLVTGKWESKELHHIPPQKDGGLFDFIEVWPEEHAAIDASRYLGD